MKRDYEYVYEDSSSSKIKTMDAGEDELLAALGYKVRSSDMADVAHKLEQLDKVLGSGPDDGSSHLASDTVHYNPTDLAAWLDNMLSELNGLPSLPSPPYHPLTPADSSTIAPVDFSSRHQIYGSNFDHRPTPGKIDKKKMMMTMLRKTRPLVLVDSQETGVRLVHALLGCADAVQQENTKAAEDLVKQIGVLAASQAGAMRKVATYFAEALARRIYRFAPTKPLNSLSDALQMHFYDSFPYLKFAHFTANQAIFEAFAGKSRVHVIDFSLKQGMQWPALIQALALRPGGPPVFRLTAICLPQADNSDQLQEVGWKLAQLAEIIHVKFEYSGFVANNLADLEAHMLEIQPNDEEAVAVNSVFELHRLLAHPGAIDKMLESVKAVRPSIVTIVEQEANHNGPVFLDRFTEALHYYSTMFDSLEGTETNGEDRVLSEMYLGMQICNVVACDGDERVERHETMAQWRARMGAAGFEPVHLGSNAFKQASMLLALFGGGDGYRVEESDGCLMLGWHTRPLIATSSWHIVEH